MSVVIKYLSNPTLSRSLLVNIHNFLCLKVAVKTAGITGPDAGAAENDGNSDNAPVVVTQQSSSEKANDALLAHLLTLEPKNLLKEIVSGRVPVSILDRITGRLPAEMLQEALDYLTNTKSDSLSPSAGGKTPSTTQPGSSSADTGSSGASMKPSAGNLPNSAAPIESSSDNGKAGCLKRKFEGFDVSKVNSYAHL